MRPPFSFNGQKLIMFMSIPNMCEYARSTPPGAFVEVGVYQGRSASKLYEIAQHEDRELFLYDTFCGMPFAGPLDGNEVGKWSETSVEAVQRRMPKAHVISGVFPDTLVEMPPVAFVHADADQYQSTADICRFFPDLMVAGGMILFDDYGYPNCLGCTAAVDEFFPDRQIILLTGKALVVIDA